MQDEKVIALFPVALKYQEKIKEILRKKINYILILCAS